MREEKTTEKPTMLTATKFAEVMGIAYATAISWLHKNLVPGAELCHDPQRGYYWQIPISSLDKIERPKPGPKPNIDKTEHQKTVVKTRKKNKSSTRKRS